MTIISRRHGWKMDCDSGPAIRYFWLCITNSLCCSLHICTTLINHRSPPEMTEIFFFIHLLLCFLPPFHAADTPLLPSPYCLPLMSQFISHATQPHFHLSTSPFLSHVSLSPSPYLPSLPHFHVCGCRCTENSASVTSIIQVPSGCACEHSGRSHGDIRL